MPVQDMVSFSVRFGGNSRKASLKALKYSSQEMNAELRGVQVTCTALQGVSESHLKLQLCSGCEVAR